MRSSFRSISQLDTRRIAAGLLASLVSCAVCLPAEAGKSIDWDKKLAKARNELSLGRVDEAIKMTSDMVKKHPDAAAPRTELGKALKKKGQLGQAKAEFKRATEVDSGFAEAYYELGALEEYDKEYELAMRSFEKYLQLAPASDKRASVTERIRNCREKL